MIGAGFEFGLGFAGACIVVSVAVSLFLGAAMLAFKALE